VEFLQLLWLNYRVVSARPRRGVAAWFLRALRPGPPPCAACGRTPRAGDYQWDWFGRAYCLCQGCRQVQSRDRQPPSVA